MSAPCKECGTRPKEPGRHRCTTCRLRHEPIDVRVAASAERRALVPEALRVKRVPPRLWPFGQRWCAGCQSFVDLEDVAKGAGRCKACQSAATHSAMIERTYGLTRADYDALLLVQGGRCGICRNKPGKKRLAVDHDHKSGKVRGLLCGRCNHELLGAGFDSVLILEAGVEYLTHPPATGAWTAPEIRGAQPAARAPRHDLVPAGGSVAPGPQAVSGALSDAGLDPWGDYGTRYLPAGSESDPKRGRGYWRLWVEAGTEQPPF